MEKHQYDVMAEDEVEEEEQIAMNAAMASHEEPRAGRRRFAVRAAFGTIALAATAVVAVSLHRNQSVRKAAMSIAVARGEGISIKEEVKPTAAPDPFGVIPGPAYRPEDFLAGAIPEFGTLAAHYGSPPEPSDTPSGNMPGCPGVSCNNGNLCCGEDSKCCGTSCVASDGICCNADIGLVCSGGSMCCWGKLCCSPSFLCGQTRDYSDGLKYIILKQCGGGAQIRRLSDRVNYRNQMNKVQSANETGVRELLGQ